MTAQSFSSAGSQVTKEHLNLDWGPDARPKIVVDRQGRHRLGVLDLQGQGLQRPGALHAIHGWRKSFAELRPITTNNESQRFEALGLDVGRLGVRGLARQAQPRSGAAERPKYEGAGLFFASSNDGGATYSEARLAQDNTCECCRLGLAFAGPGRPVVVFRNIFEGGVRDHAIMTFARSGDAGRGTSCQQG